MRIAIIGHGKMGRMIEGIAKDRGHEIVAVIDEHNREDFATAAFASADIAIEFSRPEGAVDNILHSFAAGVPVVCGTTGWLDSMPEIEELCNRGEGTLLWSSNFSIGMNIFMALNRYLADIMVNFPQYKPSLEEVHHVHKLDHPSGTAITLAEQLIQHAPLVQTWREQEVDDEQLPDGVLPIKAVREGEVPGIHSIQWDSDADSITITHSAKSRYGFALGAVLAAEWLAGKKGFHTMAEMLSDYTKTSGLFV